MKKRQRDRVSGLGQKLEGEETTSGAVRRDNWWHPTILSNIVIVPLTVGLLLTSYYQWKTMQQSLEVAERAWLTIKTANLNQTAVVPGHQPVATLQIQNSGNSPALDVVVDAFSRVQEIPTRGRTFPFTEFTGLQQVDRRPSQAVIGPDVSSQVPLILESALSEQDVAAVRDSKGSRQIVVYGIIRYRDIFGAAHEQVFCYRSFSNAPDLAPCGAWNEVIK